jgi:hypothetical protein
MGKRLREGLRGLHEGQAAMRGFWERGEAAHSGVLGVGGGNDYPLGTHRGSAGIHAGMRGLEEAFDGHWVPVENDEEESNKEEGGESELDRELVGLSEEAADYRAFWRAKYGGEYQALVAGEDGRNVPEELEKEKGKEGEKEKEKEGDEGDEMEVDGMVAGPSGSVD